MAKAITQLLNYVVTHPNMCIQFPASNMILHVNSNASYLLLPQARSCTGGYYYLSNASHTPSKPPTTTPPGTEPSMPYAINFNMSWPQLPRWKLATSSSMDKKQRRHAPHSKKWASTTAHPNKNQQFHSFRNHQWHGQTVPLQSNGYEVLLGARQGSMGTVPHLLASWHQQSCQLLHKTPSRLASLQHKNQTPPGIPKRKHICTCKSTEHTARVCQSYHLQQGTDQ